MTSLPRTLVGIYFFKKRGQSEEETDDFSNLISVAALFLERQALAKPSRLDSDFCDGK